MSNKVGDIDEEKPYGENDTFIETPLSLFLSLSMRKYLGQFACLPCTNAHTEQEKIDFFKVLK